MQPRIHTTQDVKITLKALKLMKIGIITTQYNNNYVIILQLLEKLY